MKVWVRAGIKLTTLHLQSDLLKTALWGLVQVRYVKNQASRKKCAIENVFSYFFIKTYVVGTQKNRLDETVILSTQNKCLNLGIRNYSQFYAKHFVYLDL